MHQPIARSEQNRLNALESLDVLDTPAEHRFDRFTRLAAMTFGAPIALVSLVDGTRQWFKSRCGLDAAETPRSIAFCSHAVAQDEMLVVEDAARDPRFAANPLVTGDPHIRFYAGQPLRCDGHPVGTLCIIDRVPRTFTHEQRQALRDLADLAEAELNHVKTATARLMAEQALKALNAELEQRVAERTAALEEKQEMLDAILESIDVGVIACDVAGNPSLFNRAARSIVGREFKTIVPAEWSRYYAMYHPDGRTPLAMDEIPLVRALKGETVRDEQVVLAPENGPVHQLLVSGRPLRSASGRPLGAMVAMKDVTEAAAARALLETSERRLRAITENLPAMIGKVNAAGQFVFLNARALHVYGKSAAALLGQPVASAYRPEDYAQLAPWIARVEAGERVFFEWVAMADGRERHYQCSFVPQRTSEDQPDGFFAMAFDITERKEGELRLAESEERLRTITDNVPVLIAHLDGERRYAFANAVHQSWLGKPAGEILGKTMEEAFGADYLAPQAKALELAWRGQASQCEHEIVRKKHTRIVHTTFLPQVREGVVVGVYVLTTDATASRLHERSLHALAHTDTLTGLPNRRHFESALRGSERARDQPFRPGRGTALLYLDVDRFKQINDRYGHAVGDAVLVEFAARLRGAVRSTDLVSRLAGDEFTVLLSDVAGEADVESVARKILAAMQAPFALEAVVLQVRASIGAVLADQPDPAPARLLDTADRALYMAKEAGRNTWALLRLGRGQATQTRALASA